jgi:GntR family transcriptional regulator / MocR family aminotransferase
MNKVGRHLRGQSVEQLGGAAIGKGRRKRGSLDGSELEIALILPDRGERRTRRDLYEQMRNAIRAGRLAAGLQMPASRYLAERLDVSRNTISTVYELLISEGLLLTRQGAGTFVAGEHAPETRQKTHVDMAARLRPIAPQWRPTVFGPTVRYPFVVGAPDIAAFPWDLWRKIANRALRSYSRTPGRQPPEGVLALREAVAGHLSFARGIACRAEDVVATSGAQQAFDLLARVLVHRPGVVVALEDPCYPPTRLAFAAAGATVVGAPVDDEGLIIDALPAEAEVICVTPSHQFPLGVPMSPARRQALLAHARRTGAVVIEDDYDGEFRFDGRPLEALQTLDTSQQVIYVGTFSKSLFPDLRLGYVVSPEWLRGPLLAAKQVSGHPALLAQQTTAAFIAEGHLARHVRRMRRIYAERRHALLDVIGQGPEWLKPFPTAAGLHLAIRLPSAIDAERLVRVAASNGVGVYAASLFAIEAGRQDGLVLGYGVLDVDKVRAGAMALLQAVTEVTSNRT